MAPRKKPTGRAASFGGVRIALDTLEEARLAVFAGQLGQSPAVAACLLIREALDARGFPRPSLPDLQPEQDAAPVPDRPLAAPPHARIYAADGLKNGPR